MATMAARVRWRGVPLTERALGWAVISGLILLMISNHWWALLGPVAFEVWVTVDNLVRLGTVFSRNEDLRHRRGHRLAGAALILLAVAVCIDLGVTGHPGEISLVLVPAAVIAWTDWLRSALTFDTADPGDAAPR